MPRTTQTPTVQYCIEGRMPGDSIVVERFTIEQVEAGPKAGKVDHPNYNTVQRHLSELSRKTGLDYAIVRWGDPMDRRAWIAGGVFND